MENQPAPRQTPPLAPPQRLGLSSLLEQVAGLAPQCNHVKSLLLLTRCTVPDDKPTPEQQPSTNRSSEDAAALERLEKDADEMAERGQEVEKRYDSDHGIFNK